MNRTHKDTLTLEESNEKELDFFRDRLKDTSEEFRRQHAKELESHVSIYNAVQMLDGLFHNHIKTEWKPKALEKIQALINNCEK